MFEYFDTPLIWTEPLLTFSLWITLKTPFQRVRINFSFVTTTYNSHVLYKLPVHIYKNLLNKLNWPGTGCTRVADLLRGARVAALFRRHTRRVVSCMAGQSFSTWGVNMHKLTAISGVEIIILKSLSEVNRDATETLEFTVRASTYFSRQFRF